MRLRVEQPDVLVLPGNVEQPSRRLRQLRGGRERAVHPRPAAPLPLDGPADHELGARRRQPELRQPGVRRSRIPWPEERLHFRLLGPGPDRVGLRAAAQDEVQRIDEDALPGSRLAGEHVEPGREVRLQFVDDGKRANAEQFQHAGTLADPPDIACTSRCAGSGRRPGPGMLPPCASFTTRSSAASARHAT